MQAPGKAFGIGRDIITNLRQIVADYTSDEGLSIWTAKSMHDAARLVGEAIRNVHGRDAEALEKFGIDFNVSMIFGGQINGERCRLFQMYSAGNFIESHDENTYFQIGESKYGKPIIDRVISTATPLDEAAKCALISMDSTLRSNISVGFPLDLLVYETDALAVSRFVTIDEKNQYFQMIRNNWGKQLKSVFEGIDDPVWNAAPETTANVLSTVGSTSQPVRILPPTAVKRAADARVLPLQTLAQDDGGEQQH